MPQRLLSTAGYECAYKDELCVRLKEQPRRMQLWHDPLGG